jgi:hypothetical protein
VLPLPTVDAVVVVLSIVVNLEQVRKVATVRPMVQTGMVDITAVEAVVAWEVRHQRLRLQDPMVVWAQPTRWQELHTLSQVVVEQAQTAWVVLAELGVV